VSALHKGSPVDCYISNVTIPNSEYLVKYLNNNNEEVTLNSNNATSLYLTKVPDDGGISITVKIRNNESITKTFDIPIYFTANSDYYWFDVDPSSLGYIPG
jgi:hypothetical protein